MNALRRRTGSREGADRRAALHHIGRSTATLALLATLLVGASPARAATVTCPEAPLLSEEIARAGSVFVGEVRGPATVGAEATVSGPVVHVLVEEIWRGPRLASTVRVSNPLYAGAPRIELTEGGRYLFLADPTAGPDAREPVEDLLLRECSLTRPLTTDLAGLRPSDAVVMPGFEPVPAERGTAPVWPWAVAGALVVLTAAAFLLRGRMGTAGRWLPWASGAATLATVAVGVGLTLAGPEDSSARVPASASATLAPNPPDVEATPAASRVAVAEDPTLIIRISDSGTTPWTFGQYVSIHADGRVIASTVGDRVTQQRLTADGVERIREAVEASGMFGPDAPVDATYTAVPRPGAESPQRGAFGERIVAGRGDGTVSVGWTPIFEQEAELWQPSAEIARLDELAALLWAPDAWLPADAWLERNPVSYQAARFRLTDDAVGMTGSSPPIALADLDWPLATPLTELPATRNPVGLLTRCLTLTRAEAVEVVGRLARLFGDPTLGLGSRLAVELAGDVEGRVHRLSIEPLMPDESGCVALTPMAGPPVLAPGTVALVRVDGLRMREGPGSEFAATDGLRAGERVTVVTESSAQDGSAWWLVRQGPGDRQGWVSAGPAGGDPWLVAIGNGAIAFSVTNAGAEPSQLRSMQPDGSGELTIADAATATWSPDGTHLALAVPPVGAATEWEIAVAQADGSGIRRLTDGGGPVWSPDGTRIAFQRYEAAGPSVYVIGADGTGLERVAAGASPAWSPDGSALAVWRQDLSVRPPGAEGVVPIPEALFVVQLDGEEERQLTPFEVRDASGVPAWSPDGRMIAAGDQLLGTDGTTILRLEPGDTWADLPWSPDGEDLVVMDGNVDGTGGARIGVLSVDTGEIRELVPAGDGAPFHLSWSPDGQYLVYASVRWDGVGGWESLRINVVPAAGGEPQQVGPEDSQSPGWQPIVSHPLD